MTVLLPGSISVCPASLTSAVVSFGSAARAPCDKKKNMADGVMAEGVMAYVAMAHMLLAYEVAA